MLSSFYQLSALLAHLLYKTTRSTYRTGRDNGVVSILYIFYIVQTYIFCLQFAEPALRGSFVIQQSSWLRADIVL